MERNVVSDHEEVEENDKLRVLEEYFNDRFKSESHISFIHKIKDTDIDALNTDEIKALFIDILASLKQN